MYIEIAREITARIWCDPKMSGTEMDVVLAEEIAQLLASRLTPIAGDRATAASNEDGLQETPRA